MNCLACGLRSGYNRVVVDLHTGSELGGLCFRCEENYYGTSLRDGHWAGSHDCVLCPRDGHVALPEWVPVTHERGGSLVLENDYEVCDTVPRVCDEHLAALQETVSRARLEMQR